MEMLIEVAKTFFLFCGIICSCLCVYCEIRRVIDREITSKMFKEMMKENKINILSKEETEEWKESQSQKKNLWGL